jgi:LPS-assembly lipoprotein
MRAFFIFILLFTITSCGFHVRGSMPLAPPLHQLYLQTSDPYGDLAHNLRQYLKASGVHLTEKEEEATAILHIISEVKGQQLLGISGTQQVQQYNLTLTVTFSVSNPQGKTWLQEDVVSETRTLTIQADQILASSNEANNLYQQMEQAIVYDIMSRLASQDVTALIMETKPTNTGKKIIP